MRVPKEEWHRQNDPLSESYVSQVQGKNRNEQKTKFSRKKKGNNQAHTSKEIK